jgi:hypothetical protein
LRFFQTEVKPDYIKVYSGLIGKALVCFDFQQNQAYPNLEEESVWKDEENWTVKLFCPLLDH